ncbi:MAG: oligosaccharide flippase family protein [Lutimonas sp.]
MNNMGIVFNQSFKNTLILILGFAIGGVNVLFLYTHFLEAEYFGLVTFLLSSANLVMPLLVFGMQHTIVKFFSAYNTRDEQDSFLMLALVLPLLFILPLAFIGTLFYSQIAQFLSRENIIIEQYTYLIFAIAVFMGYFEVFYAWSRVQLKSVFGGFVREIFARICISFLLIGVYLGWIGNETFVYAIAVVYLLRMIIMKIYALWVYCPRFRGFSLPVNMREIMSFSVYIILAGSAGTILLEIDKFMIPQLTDIAEVAYYSVGVYIASVIAIPNRAMQQIINPITAKELNANNLPEVENLYRRSSLNLLIIGGLLFLLINSNIREIYEFIDKPEYTAGMSIVLIISLSELIKLSLGTNGAILTNSHLYRILFYFSLSMAASVFVLNKVLIEYMGIEGAALATLIVVLVFAVMRVYYVYRKLDMQPFDRKTGLVLLLIGLNFAIFFSIQLNLPPLLAILIKSAFISVIFLFLVLRLKISDDLNTFFDNFVSGSGKE